MSTCISSKILEALVLLKGKDCLCSLALGQIEHMLLVLLLKQGKSTCFIFSKEKCPSLKCQESDAEKVTFCPRTGML